MTEHIDKALVDLYEQGYFNGSVEALSTMAHRLDTWAQANHTRPGYAQGLRDAATILVGQMEVLKMQRKAHDADAE